MTDRVVIAAPADLDTAEILAWLTRNAGHSIAVNYNSLFERLYDRLADHPDSGSLRPALGADIRIAIVSPYVVIYRHDAANNVVAILRIVHGRRRITGQMLSSLS